MNKKTINKLSLSLPLIEQPSMIFDWEDENIYSKSLKSIIKVESIFNDEQQITSPPKDEMYILDQIDYVDVNAPKRKKKKKPYWVFTIYFMLDVILTLGVYYGPQFGILPRMTYWTIMSVAFLITVLFYVCTSIKEVASEHSEKELSRVKPRCPSRVTFAQMVEITYM